MPDPSTGADPLRQGELAANESLPALDEQCAIHALNRLGTGSLMAHKHFTLPLLLPSPISGRNAGDQ
jgi:hypothetical protein